jgi:hypothetical protein
MVRSPLALLRVRYCIVRHVGFLGGHGRRSGDGSVEPETVDKVIALLRRPIPASEALEAALGRLSARTVVEPSRRKSSASCQSERFTYDQRRLPVPGAAMAGP